ncbi:hypothetical protein ALTERO38_20440 [Alteromonas sp. 38]|nr:hypothetical protein ALTERO38_20440 [Alteromonas sp. 38]
MCSYPGERLTLLRSQYYYHERELVVSSVLPVSVSTLKWVGCLNRHLVYLYGIFMQ